MRRIVIVDMSLVRLRHTSQWVRWYSSPRKATPNHAHHIPSHSGLAYFKRHPDLLQRIILGASGLACKAFMTFLCDYQVYGRENLLSALNRQENRSLLSVCNHAATLDDPALFATVPWKYILDVEKFRWALAAKEICFTSPLVNQYFYNVKAIPIIRGEGIYQPCMQSALGLVNEGAWIHVFSEALINQSNELRKFKWGIGRLIQDADHCPLILPFYHRGMQDMIPLYTHYPRPFKKVVLAFGEPLDLQKEGLYPFPNDLDPEETRAFVTDRIEGEVRKLKVFVDEKYKEK